TRFEFEVAAIRPAMDDGDQDIDSDGGYLKIHNLTLKRLVSNAWQIDESAISGGPNWAGSDGFDINARIPRATGATKEDALREMVQNLLADRFHLSIHREARQISGYELVVSKRGAKMDPAQPEQQGSESNSNGSRLSAKNYTMEAFVRRLSRMRDIGKPVVDKTGLQGGFNFSLEWTPAALEQTADAQAPPILTAIQEQLGLKLEAAKITI